MQLIDFQLLVTHIVAFLIVLWLLRRFAWGPVLKLLDQRREKIRDEFADIESKHQEADRIRQEYESNLRNIEMESRQKIQEGVMAGNAAAGRIKERAQDERRLKLERADEEVQMLEDAAKETLRRRTVDLALRAAEKAIQERMDEVKHRELIEHFIDEVESGGERRGA